MSALEARAYDGEVHLYLASDLADDAVTMLEPLHNDGKWHPDYHDRKHLSGPITHLDRHDVCESCKLAARQRAQSARRKTTAVPQPRRRAGRHPERDGPTAPAGAHPRAPAGAPRRQAS